MLTVIDWPDVENSDSQSLFYIMTHLTLYASVMRAPTPTHINLPQVLECSINT